MDILRIVAVLAVSAIAIIAILLVLGAIEGDAARDASTKTIAVLAIIGVACGIVAMIRK